MTVNAMTNEIKREEEVRQLVYDWFEKITYHAPIEDIIIHFFDDTPNMRMHFPDQDVSGIGDFRLWYSTVINTYFDQAHVVKSLEIELDEDSARVTIQVEWSAKYWEAPSPRSVHIRMDAFQNWRVIYNHNSKRWGIKLYFVEDMHNVASTRN